MRRIEDIIQVVAMIVAFLFFVVYLVESMAKGSWLLVIIFMIGLFALVMAINQSVREYRDNKTNKNK